MVPQALKGQFTFSQSALEDFTECRRRFLLRFIRRLEWPAPRTAEIQSFEAAAKRGQAFHQFLQQDQLGLEVDQQIQASGDPLLKDWWRNYRQQPPANLPAGNLLSEVEVSVPFAGYRLMARFDRVVVAEDELVLIDWKTGRQLPDFERYRNSWQSALYRYVAAEGGHALPGAGPIEPENIRLVYWFAGYPDQVLHLDYSTEEHRQVSAKITAAIEAIAAGSTEEDFPLVADLKPCRRCMYHSYCRRDLQPEGGWELDEEEWDWDLLPEADI